MRLAVYLFLVGGLLSSAVVAETTTWHSWRGSADNGIAPAAQPAITWSETENIKWKVELPGEGQSTPIVLDDRIVLLQAIPTAEDNGEVRSAFGGGAPPSKAVEVPYRFVVMCLDRETGEILWERQVTEKLPHEGHHPTASLAPNSPVTDGKYIWAGFGSRGLYCLDLEGNIIWEREADAMRMAGRFGEGSSPLLVDDNIVVLSDHEGQSTITAFDKMTGSIAWQNNRDEISSWSTPIAAEVNGRTEIITAASNAIRSYDAETGQQIWQCSGLTNCAAASPVVEDGVAYFSTGFRGISTMAIELGREGDLTGTDAVLWSSRKVGTNVPSPLIYDDRLYIFRGYAPNLSAFDPKTGEALFMRQTIEGLKNVYASPIAANGHIYISSRNGATAVVKPSDSLEVLAVNKLDAVLDGSPVAVGNELYLRGRSKLYCVVAD